MVVVANQVITNSCMRDYPNNLWEVTYYRKYLDERYVDETPKFYRFFDNLRKVDRLTAHFLCKLGDRFVDVPYERGLIDTQIG